MKKHTRVVAFLLILALSLCACGGSSGDTAEYGMSETALYTAPASNRVSASGSYDYDYAAESEEQSNLYSTEDATAIADGTLTDTEVDTERKIIYTGSMNLQTKEFDKALEDISALISENGGYISSQETNGRSLTYSGGYYSRYANLTVRIPAEKFSSLMTGVSGICNVTEQSVWTNDISDSYYDTEAHLSTLKLQEERLLDILSKAEKLDDIISLESALSDVRYQIESITAQLRRMDNSVTYSTLTLYLNEVVEYSEIESEPETFAQKLSGAAKRSGRSIAEFFENLILWIVEELPVVLLWAVLILAVLWVAVRALRLVFGRKDSVDSEKPRRKPRLPWRKKQEAADEKPAEAEKPTETGNDGK